MKSRTKVAVARVNATENTLPTSRTCPCTGVYAAKKRVIIQGMVFISRRFTDFVEQNAGGYGDVEGFDGGGHWNGDGVIGVGDEVGIDAKCFVA